MSDSLPNSAGLPTTGWEAFQIVKPGSSCTIVADPLGQRGNVFRSRVVFNDVDSPTERDYALQWLRPEYAHGEDGLEIYQRWSFMLPTGFTPTGDLGTGSEFNWLSEWHNDPTTPNTGSPPSEPDVNQATGILCSDVDGVLTEGLRGYVAGGSGLDRAESEAAQVRFTTYALTVGGLLPRDAWIDVFEHAIWAPDGTGMFVSSVRNPADGVWTEWINYDGPTLWQPYWDYDPGFVSSVYMQKGYYRGNTLPNGELTNDVYFDAVALSATAAAPVPPPTASAYWTWDGDLTISNSGSPPYSSGVIPSIGMYRLANSYTGFSPKDIWTMVVSSNTDAQLAELEQTSHPNPVKLIYANAVVGNGAGAGFNLYSGLSKADAIAINALAKDAGNNYLQSFLYDAFLPVMDSQDYADAVCAYWLDRLQQYQNIDGIFWDNVSSDYQESYAGTAVQYANVAEWQAKSKIFWTRVCQFFQERGYKVGGNASARNDDTGALSKDWWELLTYSASFRPGRLVFDAVMREHWMYVNNQLRGDNELNYYSHWNGNMLSARDAQDLGADFIGYDNGPDTQQNARYLRGTLLLNWNGGYGCSMFNIGTSGNAYSDYTFAVGAPISNYTTEANGVRKRVFQNGLVLVNPTASTQVQNGHTIASKDAYIGLP